MLVLARREQESILIGDNIKIMVVSINKNGGQVKIGIEAPLDINIRREEIEEEK